MPHFPCPFSALSSRGHKCLQSLAEDASEINAQCLCNDKACCPESNVVLHNLFPHPPRKLSVSGVTYTKARPGQGVAQYHRPTSRGRPRAGFGILNSPKSLKKYSWNRLLFHSFLPGGGGPLAKHRQIQTWLVSGPNLGRPRVNI